MKTIIFALIVLFPFTTINAQVNLEEGLIAYYPFNGNADDASGNGHHGIINGPILVKDKDGNSNSAYQFDGNDDFIQVADHVDLRLGGGGYTISLWAKIKDYSNPTSLAFVSKRNGLNNDGYQIHINGLDNGSIIGNPWMISSGGPAIGSQIPLDLDTWHHILVTGDAATNTTRLYINCTLDTEKEFIPLNVTTSSDLFLGLDELTLNANWPCCDGYHLNGTLDEIRFYDRVLNTDEITFLCQESSTSFSELSTPKIKIYPNPVNNTLFIQIENEQIEEMSLFNLSGQAVYQGKFKKEISVADFTSGIYFLQLKNKYGEIIKTEKVVIINEIRV